ncbi:hypothetical protein D3C72_1471780 [compost metagenome]
MTAASAGVSILMPLAYPNLDSRIAQALLAGCTLTLLLGLGLFWNAWRGRVERDAKPVSRRWTGVGFGQGWIEIRVRNNSGAEFLISANPGGGADQIAFDLSFVGTRRPKRSDTVEMVLEVDGEPFELDLTDTGGTTFSVRAVVWRDLEYLRRVVSSFRRGEALRVSISSLGLVAEFTLDGAYEALQEVENLGAAVDAAGCATND